MTALHVDLFPAGDALHPHAFDFFSDPSRFCMALAGTRGAKTYTGAKRFWKNVWYQDWPAWHAKRAAGLIPEYRTGAARRGTALWWDRRPRLHYWVVAPEHVLLDEPKRYLLQFLPTELMDHADNSKGRWWLKGDILIEFRSAHDPKMLVAVGLDGVWMDETDRMKAEAWRGNLRARISDKTGWAQATTTPLGRTWTYADFEKPARDGVPGYGFHTWRTVDNTSLPTLAAEVELAKRTLPPQYFRREYEASRDAFIGQIYADFDEHTMVEPLPKHVTLYTRAGGQDWGFTHPGAAIVGGASSTDLKRAHVWVVDERYTTNRLAEDYWIPEVLKLNAQWRFNDWACDPEAPDDIQRYRNAGIKAFGHRNFTAGNYDEHQRSVKAGIRLLSALMFQKRFHVTPNCKNLIEEIKGYRWKQAKGSSGASEALVEEPDPNQADHGCISAGELVTTARGDVPIELIAPGDMVLTRSGPRSVIASGMTDPSAPIWRVEFSCGRSIEGTADHPIFTERGWIRLDSLRYGDIVTTCPSQSSSSSMERHSDGIPTRQGSNSAGTTPRAEAAIDCTALSGSSITDRSRTATTFITSTGTRSITTFQTLSASQGSITSASMSRQRCDKSPGRGSRPFDRSRPNGTGAKKAGHGIQSTGGRPGSAGRKKPGSANGAASHMGYSSASQASSAQTLARLPHVGTRASTTLIDRAANAGSRSGLAGTRRPLPAQSHVLVVYETGRSGPVYNLTIEGEHEFFVNGVLLHNCDALRYMATSLMRGATFQALPGVAA